LGVNPGRGVFDQFFVLHGVVVQSYTGGCTFSTLRAPAGCFYFDAFVSVHYFYRLHCFRKGIGARGLSLYKMFQ
jgi:hypothetical protein